MTDGLEYQVRMDMTTGAYFVNYGEFQTFMGLDSDAWFSMNLQEMMGLSPEDYAALMTDAMDMNPSNLSGLFMGELPMLPLTSLADYDSYYRTIANLCRTFSDENWEVKRDTATLDTEFADETLGLSGNFVFVLDMDDEEVDGYDLSGELTFDLSQASGGMVASPAITVTFESDMDNRGNFSAAFGLTYPGLMGMTMEMDGDYEESNKTPEVTPPEDAEIVDLMEMMAPPIPSMPQTATEPMPEPAPEG